PAGELKGIDCRAGRARSAWLLPGEQVLAPATECADVVGTLDRHCFAEESAHHATVFQPYFADAERRWNAGDERSEVFDRHAPHFDVDGHAALAYLHQTGTEWRAAGEGVESVD